MKIFESSARRGNVYSHGKEFLRAAACWILVAQLAALPLALAAGDKSAPTPAPTSAARDPVLEEMQNEINGAPDELGKTEQPPYYVRHTVYEHGFVVFVSAYG